MKCEIIRDLIPLYVDQCCSDASRTEVEIHLQTCKECNSLLKHMSEECNFDCNMDASLGEIPTCSQVSIFKASVLQSVLFLFSFLLIIIGVSKEAATGYDASANSIWLFNLIIPVTAFMITMVNWYFVRFYRSQKIFSVSCSIIFIVICLIANVWGLCHYEFMNNLPLVINNIGSYLPGVILAIVFTAISHRTATIYAKFMGKF